MKYLVVSSSQRFQSQSAKVAEFITREIKTKQLAEAEHLELCGFNILGLCFYSSIMFDSVSLSTTEL